MTERSRYRVRMDGGDGYCPFFSSVQILERADEAWFPATLGDWGAALLFRIVEGSGAGAFVAISGGAIGGQERYLLTYGYLNGVAHRVLKPDARFAPSDTDPCGKTVVFLIRNASC